jgi:hypothetical protein
MIERNKASDRLKLKETVASCVSPFVTAPAIRGAMSHRQAGIIVPTIVSRIIASTCVPTST